MKNLIPKDTNENVFKVGAILLLLNTLFVVLSLLTGRQSGVAVIILIVSQLGVLAALDILRMRLRRYKNGRWSHGD